MSKKFLAFELVKLNKAVGGSHDPENSYCYDVEHYNGFGIKSQKIMKPRELERRFGKLRMLEDRFGILQSGYFRPISEAEFNEYLSKHGIVA